MLARLELCPAALGPSRWPSVISLAVLASNRRPKLVSYEGLFQVFWNEHDPTQGMRQGNDRGTQYRSAIYCYGDAQKKTALDSRERFQLGLTAAGFGSITTEIRDAPEFYYAEDYHQQYLHKNPDGYCGIGGTGVACQIGVKA